MTLPDRRAALPSTATWWWLATAALFAGSITAMWLAQRPVERWAAEMVRTDCGPGAPPPPEGSPIGWVAVALAVAGIACVAVASASALRRSPGRKAMALIVIAVPAAMLVGVLLVLGGSATALVQPDIFTVGDPAGGPLCPFDSSRSF